MSDIAGPTANTGPSVVRRTLVLLLRPEPGRLHNTLMLVAGVAVIILIWETFRIPNAATACYVVMFLSRNERTSTIATTAGVMVLGPISIVLAILATMAGLSEPAVRVCAIAVLTFVAMFMSRAARSGIPFFAAGFLVVYGLTISDSVDRLGLAPFTISNTTTTSLPTLLFLPPTEALLQTLLWLILSFLIPGTVVILLNKAFGRDPARLLRGALDERLTASAAFCEGVRGARDRLEALARRGSPELLGLAALAEKDHGPCIEPRAANDKAIRATFRLILGCLAVHEVYGPHRPDWLREIAHRCVALHRGQPIPERGAPPDDAIGGEMDQALDDIAAARTEAPPGSWDQSKPGFWADGGLSAANVQFGLKVSLAVMICYTLNDALDWPGIGTSVVTCFFVALGSLGESGHKMTLRIAGCLIGAALAIVAIIVLMPIVTELPDLLVLVAAATFAAAWVASGSPRIAYAGWQIGLAFYTVVLQGFGPVTDLEAAKNRIIGILLGNVVTYVIMVTIWPVRVRPKILAKLADALRALSDVLSDDCKPGEAGELFSRAILAAHDLLLDGLYEATPPGKTNLTDILVEHLQALILPISMIAADPVRGRKQSLAVWLRQVAYRFQQDRLDAAAFVLPVAVPPGDDPAWLLLTRKIEMIVHQLGLRAA